MSDWPKHPDGRPMTYGEMTHEQMKEVNKLACEELNKYFNHPQVKANLAKILES